MALPILYPDVNGVRTSYASIELAVLGLRLKGVKAINYKDGVEIGKVRGTSANNIGRTRGTNDPEGDIEIYQEEWDNLLPLLTTGGLIGYSELATPVTVIYAEVTSPQKTRMDILEGVRFHSADRANAEGSDALTVKLSMDIMKIRWHGLFLALRDKP